MNDWAAGYRAALAVVRRLVSTQLTIPPTELDRLPADLGQDALVIDHELGKNLQKRRPVAAREAMPLLKDEP